MIWVSVSLYDLYWNQNLKNSLNWEPGLFREDCHNVHRIPEVIKSEGTAKISARS